eukprot:Mycagemm_TRINITY_DN10058_c0_g1::TRINITY_DN10058_c0_g1_i1::g.2223::m.2223 type:complete len:100 gc:universal TRINITY_DN10058_c0_g1_i1:148-447(+)
MQEDRVYCGRAAHSICRIGNADTQDGTGSCACSVCFLRTSSRWWLRWRRSWRQRRRSWRQRRRSWRQRRIRCRAADVACRRWEIKLKSEGRPACGHAVG